MMLPYNTDMQPMLLPEFGRHIQGLVDYCVSIPDRDERTACAYAIADTMAQMFPELLGADGNYATIWNQINILSRFKLDIDFPCDVITEEKMHPHPKKIPYSNPNIRLRHYGKNIEKMIDVISEFEEGEEKEALAGAIANYMKRVMHHHNKEASDDEKILRDLALYSKGKINLDPQSFTFEVIHEEAQPRVQSKKKKKK